MRNLQTCIAALMPSWAYFDRAPRDDAAPYAVWTYDTIGVDDTGSLLHYVAITVDAYARDTADASGASALADMAAALDAAFVRAHMAAADGTGSSALVVLSDRQTQRDIEDEGVAWQRSVYTTTWSTI
ncbi:MAG: hypothetical protein WC265_08365 [Dysgonamonadaceae bacterium]|jgi:hypothetical protein